MLRAFAGFFKTNKWVVYAASLTVFITFLQLFSTACGLGMTFDSELNLAMAKEFTSTQLTPASGLAIKAPLLPWLLSFMPTDWIRFLFAGLIACTTYLSLTLANRYSTGWFLYFIALPIACSTSLLMIHSFLWADALMIFLMMALLATFDNYLAHRSSRLFALILLLSAGLVFTRYAGILIVGSVFLWMIFSGKARKKHALLYGFVLLSCIVLLLLVEPGIVSFRLSEVRETGITEIMHNASVLTKALSHSFAPIQTPDFLSIVLVFVLAIYVLIRRKAITPIQSLALTICIVYFIALLFIFKVPADSAEKYLAPCSLVLFVFVAPLFNTELKKPLLTGFMVLCFLWTTYPIARTIKNSLFWNKNSCEVQSVTKNGNTSIGLKRFVLFQRTMP